MNVAAQHHDPDHLAEQQAAARRLGIAILVSSVAVATFASLVYMRSPNATLAPRFVGSQSAGFAADASSDVADPEILSVLNSFVAALERRDDARLRALFPAMTTKQARTLHGIRQRMGAAADLSLSNLRARRIAEDDVAEDFVIVSHTSNGRELRLPFAAVVHRQNNEWKIVELH